MITIVTGIRAFNDPCMMDWALKGLPWTITRLVSGNAPGTERLGEMWARYEGVPVITFPHHRMHTGNALAAQIHAMVMGAQGFVAFWDGECDDTRYAIEYASRRKLTIHTHVVYTNHYGGVRRNYGAKHLPNRVEDDEPPF